MKRQHLLLPVISLLVAGLISCSQPTSPASSANTVAQTTPSPSPSATQTRSDTDLAPLFSKIWRVTDAPSTPAPNTIFIFLPSGTLLQTSCVETYGIYPWQVDKATPKVLQVSENGRPAYTAEILELTDTTLRLEKILAANNETEEVTLTAVEEEFVCPDLPR